MKPTGFARNGGRGRGGLGLAKARPNARQAPLEPARQQAARRGPPSGSPAPGLLVTVGHPACSAGCPTRVPSFRRFRRAPMGAWNRHQAGTTGQAPSCTHIMRKRNRRAEMFLRPAASGLRPAAFATACARATAARRCSCGLRPASCGLRPSRRPAHALPSAASHIGELHISGQPHRRAAHHRPATSASHFDRHYSGSLRSPRPRATTGRWGH